MRVSRNDVTCDFELTPSQIATLWSYTHERMQVTARLKPLRAIDRLRGQARNGEIFRSPAGLVAPRRTARRTLYTRRSIFPFERMP